MKSSRYLLLPVVSCLFTVVTSARVGESKEELIHRYGAVTSMQPAIKSAQGRRYTYGEYLSFRSEDWNIRVLMINRKCEEVYYGKSGDWTEAQFKHLLEINGGRAQWEEQQARTPKIRREWKRRDKTMAIWVGGGLEIKTPVVEQTRETVEKRAKEEASKLPKF